jgi:protein arginine kinase activator
MMYCQICKKNIATVHYTEIDVDYKVRKETHMCEACAQSHGVQGPGGPGVAAASVSPFQMIEKILKPSLPETLKSLLETTCEACGMTYPEFRSGGRLGCAKDYEVFLDGIKSVLEQVQGGCGPHTGKVPQRAGKLIQLRSRHAELTGELDEAVAVENYERAAELRDALKQVEEELSRWRAEQHDED